MTTPTREPGPETPDSLLDAIRESDDEVHRDQLFDRLIARFPPEELIEAIRGRLTHLNTGEGDAVLRLVEAVRDPELLDELMEVVRRDPGLPPDRAWLALSLLDEAGRLEDDPELAERWEELVEAAGDDQAIDELAEQIEDDAEELWVPLQAIGRIEPEVRAEIVASLAERSPGPGLLEFFRVLAFAHDSATRNAALNALAGSTAGDAGVERVWAELATDHPDPEVMDEARRWLERASPTSRSQVLVRQTSPRLSRSLVTAVDGEGRGTIVLAAEHQGRSVVSAFSCDVLAGIVDVVGQIDEDSEMIESWLEDFATQPDRDIVENHHELALGLLSGSLLLCGPGTTPALRYWLERTVGASFLPRPFIGLIRDWDPAELPLEAVAGYARSILETCSDWLDVSYLTYELARAILLRDSHPEPDPARDAGAYRFLFERRLTDRLELYRRMLFWMASFWQAAGHGELGRAALGMAWQLSDPAHAVPAYPFTVELITRSLAQAIADLQTGFDPCC
jgi:hypothetical protein